MITDFRGSPSSVAEQLATPNSSKSTVVVLKCPTGGAGTCDGQEASARLQLEEALLRVQLLGQKDGSLGAPHR